VTLSSSRSLCTVDLLVFSHGKENLKYEYFLGVKCKKNTAVEHMQATFVRSPQKSTHRASQEWRMPQSSVWRILRKRLGTKGYLLHTLDSLGRWPRPACSFHGAQAASLLEFLVPYTNCFVRRSFCMALCPKPPLHRYNWLSFGKFEDTERFLIPCPRHVSSLLSPSVETCKYAMAPISRTKLEKLCTYWYAPFCCVYLVCCAAEFGNPGGAYELPCT
jgi:hypothetical protein